MSKVQQRLFNRVPAEALDRRPIGQTDAAQVDPSICWRAGRAQLPKDR
jgi:hypothetical protein